MGKYSIGADLTPELHAEFIRRSPTFPKKKSGLIRTALEDFFRRNPEQQVEKEPKQIIQDGPIHQSQA